jgi:hypothetical protein
MERRARIATVASFIAMSGRSTLTDPATSTAAGFTVASFIGHMRSVIEKSNNGGDLVFVSPAMLPKLTNDKFIALNVPSVQWFGYPFQPGSKLTKNTNLLIFKITCQKH